MMYPPKFEKYFGCPLSSLTCLSPKATMISARLTTHCPASSTKTDSQSQKYEAQYDSKGKNDDDQPSDHTRNELGGNVTGEIAIP